MTKDEYVEQLIADINREIGKTVASIERISNDDSGRWFVNMANAGHGWDELEPHQVKEPK